MTAIDPAFEDLLHDVFTSAREKKRNVITIEGVLAFLIEAPPVSQFLSTQLQADAIGALRGELHNVLLKEFAAERAALAPLERQWSYRAKTWTKSLLRVCLPSGVKAIDQWVYDEPEVSVEFEHVLVKALARVIRVRNLHALDFVLSIIENSQGAASALLHRHGISRFHLVCFLAHGARPGRVYSKLDFPDEKGEVCVFLLNDDYSPVKFVVEVLETIFFMSTEEANATAMEIHKNGRAACGHFPFSIANEKLLLVEKLAFARQHPLRASLEGQ